MRKILPSLLISVVIAFGAIRGTVAFFSDTETSSNNVLQAGKVDLKIDNTSYYNHVLSQNTSWLLDDLTDKLFFNFTDLKPSDIGEDTISIHIDDNDAWACMQINLTKNSDNTCTEPELIDDTTCTNPGEDAGELAQNLNFAFWTDDGDNVLEDNENVFKEGTAQTLFDGTSWILADSSFNLFEASGPLLGAKTYYIGKAWCFGTLAKAALPQSDSNTPANSTGGVTCDGDGLNNATQTDLVMGDISFSAVQSRNNPNFLCNPRTETPSPSPTPLACVVDYATGFSENLQGTNKNGSAVLANRSNPAFALGAPQSNGSASDNPVVASSFFSLGFKTQTPGIGGSLVLSYTNPFYDIPGMDIKVFEVTGGTYPDEKLQIEISQDGINWTLLPGIVTRDQDVDINGALPWAKYIRLTDISNIALFEATADAFDLDAVKVYCSSGGV